MALTDAMVALYSTTLAAATSSVSIVAIPTTGYRDLRLVINSVASTTAESYSYLYFNSDTSASYSRVEMSGNGSTTGSSNSSNLIPITMPSSNSGTWGLAIIDIMDAFEAKHKTVIYRNNTANSTVVAGAGRWANTAAISGITLTAYNNQYGAGTTIELFGIKA
jgi:hypothetical protein